MKKDAAIKPMVIAVWTLVALCVVFTCLVLYTQVFRRDAPPPTPTPTPKHPKREFGRSASDLRNCFRESLKGCDKIVVRALAGVGPYAVLGADNRWTGLDIELAQVIAQEIFADGGSIDASKLQFVRANTPAERLQLQANIDVDFSVGAITDDVSSGAGSRRATYNVDFVRSHALDTYSIALMAGAWPAAPAEFCSPAFADLRNTIVELQDATGTYEKYRTLCPPIVGSRRVPKVLSADSKPTSVPAAIEGLGTLDRSFLMLDSAVLIYGGQGNKALTLLRNKSGAPSNWQKIGFVVRRDEGGWKQLIEESLEKARASGRLEPICQQYQRFFVEDKLLICNKSWS